MVKDIKIELLVNSSNRKDILMIGSLMTVFFFFITTV